MRKRPAKPEGVTSIPRTPKRKEATPAVAGKSALKLLRGLSKRTPTIVETAALQLEINLEQNDRGTAILVATNLENLLQTAIERRLAVHDGEYESLFGFDSPIGTFENKIRMGYALEIFGRETRTNLLYIKAIRNAFAHAQIPMTFDHPEVKNVCALIIKPKLLRVDSLAAYQIHLLDSYDLSVRQRFINICNTIAFNLFCYGTDILKLPEPPILSDSRYEALVRPIPLP